MNVNLGTERRNEMTVQGALGVESSMPTNLAVQEAMYNKVARDSGFKMPAPHHPKDWTAPSTISGYEVRFANWLHKLNHHVYCKALDELANAKRLATGSLNFKSGSINYATV